MRFCVVIHKSPSRYLIAVVVVSHLLTESSIVNAQEPGPMVISLRGELYYCTPLLQLYNVQVQAYRMHWPRDVGMHFIEHWGEGVKQKRAPR